MKFYWFEPVLSNLIVKLSVKFTEVLLEYNEIFSDILNKVSSVVIYDIVVNLYVVVYQYCSVGMFHKYKIQPTFVKCYFL